MDTQKKDLFGYENQGGNYDTYRPVYPAAFRELLLSKLQERRNYLDLAAGTGQIFFKCVNDFSGVKIATDISSKQLGVTQDKITSQGLKDSYTILCDAMDIQNQINSKLGKEIKFDLVTIGQALHWFDTDKLFVYLKENVLASPQSILSIQSYFGQEIYLDISKLGFEDQGLALSEEQTQELKNSVSVYNSAFYDVVREWFDCDRVNLSKAYASYDFQSHFSNRQLQEIDEWIPQTVDQIIRYAKTFSAYNTFIEKNPNEVDPVKTFQEAIMNGYSKVQLKYKIKNQEPPLLLKVYFFQHVLSN